VVWPTLLAIGTGLNADACTHIWIMVGRCAGSWYRWTRGFGSVELGYRLSVELVGSRVAR